MFLAARIVFFIIISLLFYLNLPQETKPVVFIPKGSTKSILADLNKKGYDLNALDYLILRALGYPQNGWLDFKSERITKGALLYFLLHSKAALREVTLIPGETTYFVLKQLSASFGLDLRALFFEYYRQIDIDEGFFAPNTYKIPLGISARDLIALLKKHALDFHGSLARELYGAYEPGKWFKLVTMASVVQKEAASTQEMPLVASVISNRLRIGMPLQMDGALNYGRFSHTKITPQMIKTNSSSYNTYKNKGLPNAPVCLTSPEAIRAAFAPAQTDYLFFVRTGKHEHSFSKTFDEHRKNFDRFK